MAVCEYLLKCLFVYYNKSNIWLLFLAFGYQVANKYGFFIFVKRIISNRMKCYGFKKNSFVLIFFISASKQKKEDMMRDERVFPCEGFFFFKTNFNYWCVCMCLMLHQFNVTEKMYLFLFNCL